ncbi:MAG: carbamoyltransferase HypF [Cyclobacteriaceae bacterium]|nr:carbamoyltransferase HypF [Cyclobacteriaceae bacterium]
MPINTFKIQLNGRVQGVGFRPFVYNLAIKNNLTGSVSNNSKGVVIYTSTTHEKANAFLQDIISQKPKVAIITGHTIEKITLQKFTSFNIALSAKKEQISIPLTPDFGVCKHCKQEINDINNRRHKYAFTTCVHCGPRYAITRKFPFDRGNTSLANFAMCKQCTAEYNNPTNRRFHSQTNSCKNCGITLQLTNNKGVAIEIKQQEILSKAADLISEGKIIALKNTSGYLLCCDATNMKVIQRLRVRKQRPNKPFAVLYPSIHKVKNDFNLSVEEENALSSAIAPIVILQNTNRLSIKADAIAPNLNHTGVLLPSSSLLELLLQKIVSPVIATSGNLHGSPIISDNKEAEEKLGGVADYFLHHDLSINFPQDDSVIKLVGKAQIILRRSRGFAPNYLKKIAHTTKPVIAMGAHLKSTFTMVPNAHIYVSQYFGNLDDYEVLNRFKITIAQYQSLFSTAPSTIIIDKHPQYQSSITGYELKEKWNANLVEVQHHKAHFASVLGEHNLFNSTQKILGVIWDGTGLGEDNNIWGGEFFTYQNKTINRLCHFDYFDWIANDKMAKEPRLSLYSLLNKADRVLIKSKFSAEEWKIYEQSTKTNTLKTSSVGRLFDAVASALDIIDTNSYEAEAAMLLENCANQANKSDCIDLLEHKTYDNIPSKLLMSIILKAYKDGVSKPVIAHSFIFTMAKIIIDIALKNNIKTIACSGGVFQNSLLIDGLKRLSKNTKLELKLNFNLSPNDENISFGQLIYHQYVNN